VLTRAGEVSITAVAGLSDRGAPQTTAQVMVRAIVDRRVVSEAHIEMSGGQLAQIPVQAGTQLRAGAHAVGLSVEADYSARPENVVVAPVSIVATVLPLAP
jgi:hypothetical protein